MGKKKRPPKEDVAQFRCMCGYIHRVPREEALQGISVVHWKCTDCGRRFVLSHEPPDGFLPIYLDGSVRSGLIRETGSAASPSSQKNPMPPPAIEYRCRCGEKATAHSFMYGNSAVCPSCKTSMLLVLKYSMKMKRFLVIPEYPHKSGKEKEEEE